MQMMVAGAVTNVQSPLRAGFVFGTFVSEVTQSNDPDLRDGAQ
jgi:hypothetical protein